MRRYIKENLLYTLKEAKRLNIELMKLSEDFYYQQVQDALAIEQESIIKIGNRVEELGDNQDIVTQLEDYCELIWQCSIAKGVEQLKLYKCLNQKIEQIEEMVISSKEKYEIVFLPYKASMWDSLESVWRIASKDIECNCYVIPIPYYDKNSDGTLGKMHYEGDEFPEDVPITSYKDYNFEKNHPDVIFYHNPYDQYNKVTSIHPDFYTSNIYKYTDMLIYIPYFIAGYYASVDSAGYACLMMSTIFTDYFIVQSEKQKQLYLKNGIKEEKLIVLGSPKADAVKYYLAKVEIPRQWSDKLKNKKVFLLNSSISRILNEPNWLEEVKKIVNVFVEKQDIVLIWRPHPLLLETIDAMQPEKRKEYQEIYNIISSMTNAIIDEETSVYAAMKCADALISDYSSIVMQFSLTGKPVLMLVGKEEFRRTKEVCFDYFSNYFVRDGITVEAFCNMIKEGKDEKKDERQKNIRKSIVNIDGQCGIEVFKWLKEKLHRGKSSDGSN